MTREMLETELSAFPGATFGYPFDATTRVYKVGGKMFALVDDVAEPLAIALKCDPEIAVELRQEYPDVVVPGYHLNKRHWNTVTPNQTVEDDDLRDWLTHSYELVYRSLTRDTRAKITVISRITTGVAA